MGNVIDLVVKAANTFYETMSNDENGRFHSWEHCYKCFHDARTGSFHDDDYLSLQLAFYLASWGMYRGSSFLLQKDYKVHNEAYTRKNKTDITRTPITGWFSLKGVADGGGYLQDKLR